MKRALIAAIILCSALLAKERVAVSILPQKFFVEKIAADKVEVMVTIPPGASPASYNVKPSQLQKLKSVAIYFSTGVPFERHWLKRFKSVNPSMKIVDCGKYVKKFPLLSHDHDHEDHHHEDNMQDPHIWLAPPLVILQARAILEGLCELDPENAIFYRKNYRNFVKELTEIDMRIFERLQGIRLRSFIVYHPSFGYFAKVYGLKQIAIEKGGNTPPAKYLKNILSEAKRLNIKTIFIEPQFSQKEAKFLAQKIGAAVRVIDPLAYEWDKNILKIAEVIYENGR